jgi:hypothetical protein
LRRGSDRRLGSVCHQSCRISATGKAVCGGGKQCQGWKTKKNIRDPNKRNVGVFHSNPCWKLLKNKNGMEYVKSCMKSWKEGDEYKKFLLSSPAIDENEHDDD